MAKWCPITKDYVLYLDCIDCDDKKNCKQLSERGRASDHEQDKLFDSCDRAIFDKGQN